VDRFKTNNVHNHSQLARLCVLAQMVKMGVHRFSTHCRAVAGNCPETAR